ncbi:hypothetical protein AVEN_121344-1, partial [Araneus ventricosus]
TQQAIDKGIVSRSAATMKPGLSSAPTTFVSLNEINQKNFMSVNKPQVTSASDFDKLRQQNAESSFGEPRKEEKQRENFTKPVPKSVPSATSLSYQFISPKLATSPVSAEDIRKHHFVIICKQLIYFLMYWAVLVFRFYRFIDRFSKTIHLYISN